MADEPADALYGLPLERFVPERDALVKALRAEGRRDEAAEVAKLPKPTVAAWAVNQVVRTQPRLAAALWEAGDAVAAAQADLVARRAEPAALREAVDAERAALAPLADAARGLVTASGRFLGDQAVAAVVETLHAAALDPAEREPVARGRIARPLRLAGIAGAATTAAPARGPRRSGGGDEAPATAVEDAVEAPADRDADRDAERQRKAAEADRRRRVREAEREVAAAGRDVGRAEREHGRAERRADDARAALDDAQAARDEAAAELRDAEERLAAARERLDEATGE